MGMSAHSRRERDKREREYRAWYDTLTPDEQRIEDNRADATMFRNMSLIVLGAVLLCVYAIVSEWLRTL